VAQLNFSIELNSQWQTSGQPGHGPSNNFAKPIFSAVVKVRPKLMFDYKGVTFINY